MKRFFVIALVFITLTSAAQKKNYEYQDTRKKNESFVKLPPPYRAELASFTMGGIDESLGKDTLRKIPFTSTGENFMTFTGNNINIKEENITATITLAQFEAWKHKLDYDEQYLIRIDRKPFYGNYGYLPKTYISSIKMVIGKDSVAIPPAAYADLYNVNFSFRDKKGIERSTNAIYLSRDGHRIYLYLFCKDTSGSYEVTWIIQDKKYVRRVLDYGFM